MAVPRGNRLVEEVVWGAPCVQLQEGQNHGEPVELGLRRDPALVRLRRGHRG